MLYCLKMGIFFLWYGYILWPPIQNQNVSSSTTQPDNYQAHHKATSTIPSYRFRNSHPPALNPRSFHNSIPSPNPVSPLPATQNLSSSIKTPPFFGFVLICRISEKTNVSPKGHLFFSALFYFFTLHIAKKISPWGFPWLIFIIRYYAYFFLILSQVDSLPEFHTHSHPNILQGFLWRSTG